VFDGRTSVIKPTRLHRRRQCTESDPILQDKLRRIADIWWRYPTTIAMSETELWNFDRFYRRWHWDPCLMTLDYLTEDLSCVDAFLVKYKTMIPSTKPSFLSPDCLEMRGACDQTEYSVSVLGNELRGFQARLETCSREDAMCFHALEEVSDQLHLLETNKWPCSEPWLRLLLTTVNGESKCLHETKHKVHAIVKEAPHPTPSPPPLRNEFCWERRDASANTCREYWKGDGMYKYDSAHSLLLESTDRIRNKDCFDDPVCASLYMYSSYALSVLLSGKNLCEFSLTRSLFVPDASGYLCLHSFVDRVNNVTTPPLPLTEPSFPSPPPRLVVQSRLASSLFLAYLGAWLLSVLVGFFCCRFTSASPMRTGHPRVRWRRGRLSSPLAPALLPPREKAQMV